MNFARRFHIEYLILILILCFFVSLAGAYAKSKKMEKEEPLPLDLINVQGCEGVKLTHCELAMDLIATLRMGEDLTCEAGFVHLKALDIAPGENWCYGDPHKVVTLEEIKDVIGDIHRAYNEGNVRLDGFVVAERINSLCMELKGPNPSVPSEGEKEEKEKDEEVPPAPIPAP